MGDAEIKNHKSISSNFPYTGEKKLTHENQVRTAVTYKVMC